jgi:hypothetical protein
MNNPVTIILAVILAAFAVADAEGPILSSERELYNSYGRYNSYGAGKAGKAKSGKTKAGKSGYSYSMSYPDPPVNCDSLPNANSVLYIVQTSTTNFVQQSMNGNNQGGEYSTEEAAIYDTVCNRKYKKAPEEEQKKYIECWKGEGTLVNQPVYFPGGSGCTQPPTSKPTSSPS